MAYWLIPFIVHLIASLFALYFPLRFILIFQHKLIPSMFVYCVYVFPETERSRENMICYGTS